ncbi:MAG: TatD family hydrolase [Acetivibrionales bacterium]|jgi:TatD DNase family protein
MLFDTHAHYNDALFDSDRMKSVENAKQNGVRYIIAVSSDIASSIENITLAQNNDIFYAAVGVHPHNVIDLNNNIMSALTELASYPEVVAIGETGLDYYYENSPREVQKIWFAKQISLARSVKLPIIVHSRDAHEDTLNILKSEKANEVGGVMHCFSGSKETAREMMNLGFYISFAGPVTFKNAKKLPEVARYVPDDRLLIETDSPYLSPEPHRGKRNESANVRLIAEKLAEIRGQSFEHIAEITTSNAKRLFGIK